MRWREEEEEEEESMQSVHSKTAVSSYLICRRGRTTDYENRNTQTDRRTRHIGLLCRCFDLTDYNQSKSCFSAHSHRLLNGTRLDWN
jgi:hypothetical protein